MRTKTIMISGANGYIALHLARALRQAGHRVLTALRGAGGDFVMDFSVPGQVAALKADGIDAMIHTVSPNETLYKTNPLRAVAEQSAGIHAALDFCRGNHIPDFIYFSSFHVFGRSTGQLVETTPTAPMNDYGLGHCIAEQTALLYDRRGDVNAWILRPSNVFGVPLDLEAFRRWNLIPFAFCREAAEHGCITLMTPGNQLRNFVGIEDVCQGVLQVLDNRYPERILHLYGRQTLSVFDFAQLVQRVAYDALGLPIRILRPDGQDCATEFAFTSLYDYFSATQGLDSYIQDMLQTLLLR